MVGESCIGQGQNTPGCTWNKKVRPERIEADQNLKQTPFYCLMLTLYKFSVDDGVELYSFT